jgi:hypothetical protein
MPWVLYLPHGTSFARYGTDLWRYDAVLDELTVTHTDGLDGINAIEFSPVDPQLMYLGLASEDVD